jgi:hypothetical protein
VELVNWLYVLYCSQNKQLFYPPSPFNRLICDAHLVYCEVEAQFSIFFALNLCFRGLNVIVISCE